jgi:hypothetical protein
LPAAFITAAFDAGMPLRDMQEAPSTPTAEFPGDSHDLHNNTLAPRHWHRSGPGSAWERALGAQPAQVQRIFAPEAAAALAGPCRHGSHLPLLSDDYLTRHRLFAGDRG